MVRGTEKLETAAVSNQSQLEELCDCCRCEKRFAFDTEFVMEDRFAPEVCLVQIATKKSVAVIDPFLELDLAPVWALVADHDVETVVHAGQEDFALCVQHTGLTPQNAYDVQIAAGLAGFDYPLSLQKLVQQTLHVRLHKSKTLTDWRKRPLSEAQIKYGAEDVAYLLAARQKIDDRLRSRHRQAWAKEEFRAFTDVSLYRRADEEKLVRLKGTGSLKGRQLCIVRELLAWREDRASQLNRPVRAVLKDHLLVEIAKLEMVAFGEIRDLRGINLGDRDVRALCGVVIKAMETPTEQWPQPKPRDVETAREAALVAFVSGIIRSECIANEVAYGLAASKRSIRQLIEHCLKPQPQAEADVVLLQGWRCELIGHTLQEVLSGKRAVSISPNGQDSTIHIGTSTG